MKAHFSDNSLIFNQTPDLASAYNLSVSDTDSQTLCGSNADSQNLHNSIRGVPKRVI
ncbi:hypothetical protein XBP1_2720051 [Xenorhabdus bovienii str. puntauvense]|uniref:Uncharacterized protein n=1 Tax=Xenorhabdus bovienii str. puntauvense TaxID=1398201 RepID=A0A077N656_XENBV|nr:hypothetical protein XBP1_2720051 [Xenorhabdus bovienii str. puntauvense]